MDRVDAEQRVVLAVERLVRADTYLLERDVNERSITHRLAVHLASEFPGWDVDCEYNRDGFEPKKLSLPRRRSDIPDDDEYATTVFPDVVVHRRGTNASNLVVIEAKKTTNERDAAWDKMKLRAFHDPAQLGYAVTVFLLLQTGTAGTDGVAATLEFADGRKAFVTCIDRLFRDLWVRASKHARVMYNDAPNGRGTENGYFDPREDTTLGRLISICDDPDRRQPMKPCWELNNGRILTKDERVRDLITLAHEYGHLVSYLDPETRPNRPTYDGAVRRLHAGRELVEGDAELILAEEARAWREGRHALAELGFDDWERFDKRESDGLDLYRRSLAARAQSL